MKAIFNSNFFDIGKSLTNKYRYLKYWHAIRYDFPNFLRNLWTFRKALWNYYWYDYHGSMMFMQTAFLDMAKNVDAKGYEIESTKTKKVAKMYHAAKLLNHFIEDDFIELAEAELGELVMRPWEFITSEDHPGSFELVDKDTPEEKAHNRKVFDRAREIEKEYWEELIITLRGQTENIVCDDLTPEERLNKMAEVFDGSGWRGWWD